MYPFFSLLLSDFITKVCLYYVTFFSTIKLEIMDKINKVQCYIFALLKVVGSLLLFNMIYYRNVVYPVFIRIDSPLYMYM